MAIIGRIREKSGLLVIIIGLALLAFILGGYKNMSTGAGDEMRSGTVFGEKVDENELLSNVQKFEISDRQDAQKNNRPFGQIEQDQSADKAWNLTTEMSIFEKEYAALGLDVSQTELDAYLYGTDGFTVMPELAQGFVDSLTGGFSADLLRKTIERLQSSTKPEEQKSWADSKEYYISKRKQEKYNAILKQGTYVTKLEAEQEYFAQKELKSISYVVRHYSELPDEKIKVSDSDLKAFYEEHKSEKKYQNKVSSRIVKYFDISLHPSKTDSSDFDTLITGLKKGFEACKTSKEDSLFVLKKSDIKFYTTNKQATFRPENDPKKKPGLTYPPSLDTVFKSASIGQIVGPYEDNGNVRISKIVDFNTKVCKVRHILIMEKDAKKIPAAQAKADSIRALLTKENFSEYVTKFSNDDASIPQGGVYEDFMDGEGYAKEFFDFAAQQPIGTIGTVKTDFGIHIIEVMDRKEVKYPVLAIVQKTLVPSITTTQKVEDDVYKLLYKLDGKIRKQAEARKKVELFDTLAMKENYRVNSCYIQTNKPKISNFNTPFAEDKILKLAYGPEAAIGNLCASPIKDKNRYVIAIYAQSHEKGNPTFEEVEVQMRADYIKEQKAMKLAALMIKKSLSSCAKAGNTQVMSAEVNFANPQISGVGMEADVVGSIFTMKDGKTSIPLKGETGVFVVRLNKTTKATATVNYDIERKQMLSTAQGSVISGTRQALLTKADIVDNRRFLKAGIRFEH
jgi:peptidyl-prolyl cis-trans isomerase D